MSVRGIARQLGIPASSVQRCLERSQKRSQQLADALTTGQPGAVLAAIDDDWPTAEGVAESGSDPLVLNALERYRHALITGRGMPLHDTDHQRCCIAYGLDPDWRPDDGGQSWRDGVDRAMADNSGTDAADDW